MKKPVRLIGIHGFKRSGKDTVAKMLASVVSSVDGYVSPITHYADTLKKSLAALWDIDPNWFYLDDLKEAVVPDLCCETTPRKGMTDFHDALVPVFGADLFVHPVRSAWKRWTGNGVFIVADVRYDGRETDWIREAGGVIIHVQRPGVSASSHSSEQGIPIHPDDVVIVNDGDLKDLQAKVFSVAYDLRGYRIPE